MKKGIRISLISSGILMVVAPAIGGLKTVSAMVKCFETLGTAGTANPAQLSTGIGQSLVSSFLGLLIGTISAAVFVGVLIYWLCTLQRSRSNPS
jgi:biopolymer transport protein ExbB/TolQ